MGITMGEGDAQRTPMIHSQRQSLFLREIIQLPTFFFT